MAPKVETPAAVQQKRQLIRTLQDQGKLHVTKDDVPWNLKNAAVLIGKRSSK